MAETFDLAGKRVWVTGHRGMLRSALVRGLAGEPCEVLTAECAEVDLRYPQAVAGWLEQDRPDAVLLAAV